MTLVAVISDTHLPRGTRRIPDECLRRLDEADLILHAGDFTTRDVYDELRALGPLEAVYGNMDDDELRQALPQRRVVEVGEARIGIVHIPGAGAGRAERLVGWFPDCRAVVYGHTHMPELTEHRGVLILNPGSPTERRRAPEHTMALLRVGDTRLEAELTPLT